MYIAFDERFCDKDEAIEFALESLAEMGELVEVSFKNVPNCKCGMCNDHLFDFQTLDKLDIGQAGDMMDCFFNADNHMLICNKCAHKHAVSYLQQE